MPLYREVTKFSLLSGAEQAIIGWYWDSSDIASAVAGDINTNFGALWTAWRPYIDDNCTITERELVTTDVTTGAVLATTPLTVPAAATGSSASFVLPPQNAFVISLRTIQPGASGRGRFYLPGLTALSLTNLGAVVTSDRNALVDAFATYAGDVFTSSSNLTNLCVYSRTLGQSFNCTSVDAGSVWDTQRRRRNELVEGRYSVSVP